MSTTVFVSYITPVSKVMELVVEKTGCKMGNLDTPWKLLDSRVIAPPEASIETKMLLLPVVE